MKKMTILILSFIMCLFFVGCQKTTNEDAMKFKESYELLNGTSTSSGKAYKNVTVSENNPFVWSTAEEIVEKMNKGESFMVYWGANWCPWCRSILETVIETANEMKIKTIYYVDVRPDNDTEKEIRDVYALDDNGEVYLSHEGSEGYHKFITMASSVLSDYQANGVSSLDGTIYEGQKRVDAPNYILVKDGVAILKTEGVSELEEDPWGEITAEMLADTKSIMTDFFNQYLAIKK